ncbi:hypothetical protein Ddc_08663 [Ditylenchus destructor]|nr:hypothetical protein Ddc_08663 [Ditylenchus destructor]
MGIPHFNCNGLVSEIMSGTGASRDKSRSSTELARHLALFLSARLPLGFPPAIVVSWCYSTALLPLFPSSQSGSGHHSTPRRISIHFSHTVVA